MRLQGLIAAPHTPMTAEGALRPEVVPTLAAHLQRSGIQGVFINGTTGEGMALSLDERRRITEAWVAARGTLPVIAHVGAQSAEEAIALAEHAEASGVQAVSAVAPSFCRPGDTAALLAYLRPIAAAAPNLPFYYYHLPSITGVHLPAHELFRACQEGIETFAGMKFTDPDLFSYQRCQPLAGDQLDLAFGVDELLLAGLALGARAAVGSTYNYAAPIYLSMMEAFARGDLDQARHEAQRAMRLVSLLLEFGVLPAGKALMSLHGVDCGPARAPMPRLSAEDREALCRRATELGIGAGSS